MNKKHKLCKIFVFMFIKNINFREILANGEDNKLANILYINNGGFLTEGYLKYKELKKHKHMYFKQMTKQPKDYLPSGIIFTRKDIEYLLSNSLEGDYNKCYDIIINRLINNKNKDKEDYKRLYNYWRDNCYSKEEAFKLESDTRFIIVSIDYIKIKKSKEKIHKELLQKFALFRL
jgi:hypothetical protein